MLLRSEAVDMLTKRYALSRKEADTVFTEHLLDLRIMSRDVFGKLIPGAKLSFRSKDDYEMWLTELESF